MSSGLWIYFLYRADVKEPRVRSVPVSAIPLTHKSAAEIARSVR